MLEVLPVSRIECIESCGMPMSTVVMPSLALIIGPIVEPHGLNGIKIKLNKKI